MWSNIYVGSLFSVFMNLQIERKLIDFYSFLLLPFMTLILSPHVTFFLTRFPHVHFWTQSEFWMFWYEGKGPRGPRPPPTGVTGTAGAAPLLSNFRYCEGERGVMRVTSLLLVLMWRIWRTTIWITLFWIYPNINDYVRMQELSCIYVKDQSDN